MTETFEDWALQTTPSPTHLSSGPPAGTTTCYHDTAFEDWVERQQMDVDHPQQQQPAAAELETRDGNYGNWDDEMQHWEMVEGEMEVRVEVSDGEETGADGTRLRRQTVRRRRVRPRCSVLVVNGVWTDERAPAIDRVIDVSVDDDVLVLPPGVDNPDYSDNLRTTTEVTELDELLADGTPLHRRITTTTVLPASQSHAAELGRQRSAEEPPAPAGNRESTGRISPEPPADTTLPGAGLRQGTKWLNGGRDELMETASSRESPGGISPERGVSSVLSAETEGDIARRAEHVVARSVEAAVQQVMQSTSAGRSITLAPCTGLPIALCYSQRPL